MAENNATQEYGRRVDDLIAQVQQTIDDVNRFIRGEMNVPPHHYQKVKRDLMARQSMAMDAMTNAIAGQRELLSTMKTTGGPLPKRRATDTMKNEDREIADIKRRAGLDEADWTGQGLPGHSGDPTSPKPGMSMDWSDVQRLLSQVASGRVIPQKAMEMLKQMLGQG